MKGLKLEKINKDIVIDINKLANISIESLESEVDKIRLFITKRKTKERKVSQYKEIYIYIQYRVYLG